MDGDTKGCTRKYDETKDCEWDPRNKELEVRMVRGEWKLSHRKKAENKVIARS